mmetsp:Transcript_36414/g.96027  ORF Transcript_36414/g.96027 Transcript_36414/m.96027 type:complete len:239 (+) Transcript_36414:319-1035(+)
MLTAALHRTRSSDASSRSTSQFLSARTRRPPRSSSVSSCVHRPSVSARAHLAPLTSRQTPFLRQSALMTCASGAASLNGCHQSRSLRRRSHQRRSHLRLLRILKVRRQKTSRASTTTMTMTPSADLTTTTKRTRTRMTNGISMRQWARRQRATTSLRTSSVVSLSVCLANARTRDQPPLHVLTPYRTTHTDLVHAARVSHRHHRPRAILCRNATLSRYIYPDAHGLPSGLTPTASGMD